MAISLATEAPHMAGNDTDHTPSDTEPTAADAFALVGHEIRVEIIRVLGDTRQNRLPFGELRSQLITDVEPSQLHYHLQQLVGHFVKKTDGGYHLSAAGELLGQALQAGTFTRRQEHRSVDAIFDCYYCQGPVEASFDNGYVSIECSHCEFSYLTDFLDVPLEPFENTSELFSYFSQYMVLKNFFLTRGICPSCANPVSPEFYSVEENPTPGKVLIGQSCDLCGNPWSLTIGMALLINPELILFCYDHGVDVLLRPYWELEFAVTDKHVTVRSTDPWEVALEVTFDDDTLELVVDGDLNVIESNRRSASDGDQIRLPEKMACLQSLCDHRWPDGVTCPNCDSGDTIKKGTTSKEANRYRCHSCGSIFNDLTGTIFAERRFSLPEMVHVIREMDETKTAEIARQLDRDYTSVLDFVHEAQNARDEGIDFDLTFLSEGDDLL